MLNSLFKKDHKIPILGFSKFDISEEIVSYMETAVIINQSENEDTPRKKLPINDKTYINASYIKTAFNESCPESNHSEFDAPFGNVIATQGP